jgi:hypothetical protein
MYILIIFFVRRKADKGPLTNMFYNSNKLFRAGIAKSAWWPMDRTSVVRLSAETILVPCNPIYQTSVGAHQVSVTG